MGPPVVKHNAGYLPDPMKSCHIVHFFNTFPAAPGQVTPWNRETAKITIKPLCKRQKRRFFDGFENPAPSKSVFWSGLRNWLLIGYVTSY